MTLVRAFYETKLKYERLFTKNERGFERESFVYQT